MAFFDSKSPRGPRLPGRRDIFKLPLAAAAYGLIPSSALALADLPRKSSAKEDDESSLKIAVMVSVRTAKNDDLLALKQIGVRWVHADFGANPPTYDEIRVTRERFAEYDLKIHCALCQQYRSLRIQLGQPGRDEDIDKFNAFLTDCGRLGIPTSHIDFHPGNTFTTNEVLTSRGYTVREFSVDDFRQKIEQPMFDREYSADDIWANYTYFLKAILPVAEKANVRMAHHPDDPPISPMNGVAKVFINYAGFKHAEDVASGGSKNWGLCLCLGSWLEGGESMGKSPIDTIKDFGSRGKIFTVHFRNVSSPLPRFHETFAAGDEGYVDMYPLMKALLQTGSTASLIPDHYPGLIGDANHRIDNAYMVTQMRMMLSRAIEEVG